MQVRRLNSLEEWLLERFGGLPEPSARRMFGGVGFYSGETMFAILHRGRVYLKTDARARARHARYEMEPFRPRAGVELSSFWEVPPEVLDDDTELVQWARQALEAAPVPRSRYCAAETILQGHAAPIRALGERARKLVLSVAPHAQEAGYPGWRLIGYRAPHYFCFVAPMKDHVRLGFERGVELADPHGLLEGKGTQVRWVTLVPGASFPRAKLKQLIAAALSG